MSTKRFKELKNMSTDEIVTKIREIESSLFRDRMKQKTGQLEKPSVLWQARKDLARLKTLQTQAQSQTKAKR